MSFIPFMVLIVTPEASTISKRIEASHVKMTTAAVLVSDGLSNAVPTKISFSPTACRLEMPNEQIAEVKPSEIRFYDEILHQVASVKNSKALKVPDSGAKVALIQQEPITWLLDSAQRASFFKELRNDARWQVRGSSLALFEPKKNLFSQVHFDNNYRVTQIKLTVGGRTLSDWKYRYVSESEIPTIPASAKVVKGLSPRPTIPQRTDGKTVLFAQKLWRSLSRLDGRKITEVVDEGTFQLQVGAGKVSETGPKGSWTLANTRLEIRPKNGEAKVYEGGSDKFLDRLRAKGIETSPIARYLLNRKIPFLDMFDRADEVKLAAVVGNIDGKEMSVLSIKKGGIHIRMYVAPKSGDLAMVSSDATDSSGNLVSGSRLKIKYQ